MAEIPGDSASASDPPRSNGSPSVSPTTTPGEQESEEKGQSTSSGDDTDHNDDVSGHATPEHPQLCPETGRKEEEKEDEENLDVAEPETEDTKSKTIEPASTDDHESLSLNTPESGVSDAETTESEAANSSNAVDNGTPEALALDAADVASQDDDNESVYSLETYRGDNDLSNDEFFTRLERDDLELFRELRAWRDKYHIEADDLRDSTTSLLTGAIDLRDEGLDEDEIEQVKSELRGLGDLPLDELIDRIASSDVA
ncbi:hypothetical protein NP493_252g00002 [Ridgeia piscesae]|uniref:Uncharacterized protein n=1 Tax=Ridgeia piscesae TaxID=27915 RepID=A0AAD9UCU8_RIDPI|nr:hypothetical protein NP493_252g00002 [Ridgeia piscesae]